MASQNTGMVAITKHPEVYAVLDPVWLLNPVDVDLSPQDVNSWSVQFQLTLTTSPKGSLMQ